MQKRLASGAFANTDEVLRHALEAQDTEQDWTEEERRAISAHIEEGLRQADRGELVDGDEARRRMQPLKEQFLKAWSQQPPAR